MTRLADCTLAPSTTRISRYPEQSMGDVNNAVLFSIVWLEVQNSMDCRLVTGFTVFAAALIPTVGVLVTLTLGVLATVTLGVLVTLTFGVPLTPTVQVPLCAALTVLFVDSIFTVGEFSTSTGVVRVCANAVVENASEHIVPIAITSLILYMFLSEFLLWL